MPSAFSHDQRGTVSGMLSFDVAALNEIATPAANKECDVSVVIACYRDAGHLEKSVSEVVAILDCLHWSYELVFVEDCSPDNSAEVIRKILHENPDKPMRAFFHPQNTGRGATVTDGIFLSRGRIVGFLDIDLEVHARYLPSFILAVEQGAEVVLARRIYKLAWYLLHRAFLSRGYVNLQRLLLGTDIEDTEAGYKFFNREKILPVLARVHDKHWFWDTEIVLRAQQAGCRIESIPVLFLRRYDKASTVRIVRDSFYYFIALWRFRRELRKDAAAGNPARESGCGTDGGLS